MTLGESGIVDRSSARQSGVEAWRFVAFTFLWAWLFLLPAVLSSRSADEPWVVVLRILGGISPMVAASVLTVLYEDRAGRRDYWYRATQWRRVHSRWYAVIFVFVPTLALVASLLDRLLGGAGLQLEDTGSSILARPLTVLPLIAFLLFFGPIPEELGWRGYALDRLQARWSAGVASLILGLVWAS